MIRHYTEVYDISTKIGEMTVLAFHTPQAGALKKMFKGHFMNYRKYKINGCSFRIACASQLPLSMDQIGLESGEIDPRDVMNPMLFKATTGDNLNALLNQIYNTNQEQAEQLYGHNGSIGEHVITHTPSKMAYYQMLSDPTWRKAHPQQGLTVRNLKPYVHKVATTQPFKWVGQGYTDGTGRPAIIPNSNDPNNASSGVGFGGISGIEESGGTSTDGTRPFDASNPSFFISNGITPMPWMDTAIPQTVNTVSQTASTTVSGTLIAKEANWLINNVPKVYCGTLIMPPSVNTRYFMRLLIDWSISFKDWRPAYEIGNITDMRIVDEDTGMVALAATSNNYSTYFNYLHNNSKAIADSMEKQDSSFDSNNAETELVYAS